MKKQLFIIISLFLFISFQFAFAHNNFSIEIPNKASVKGKYSKLIQILQCKSDRKKYGRFNDYGYWSGGAWCGNQGKSGYWVWVAPHWYIWKSKK